MPIFYRPEGEELWVQIPDVSNLSVVRERTRERERERERQDTKLDSVFPEFCCSKILDLCYHIVYYCLVS